MPDWQREDKKKRKKKLTVEATTTTSSREIHFVRLEYKFKGFEREKEDSRVKLERKKKEAE